MSAKCVQTGLFTKFTDRLIGPLLSASNHRQLYRMSPLNVGLLYHQKSLYFHFKQ